jgi:hypothetical protein
VFAGDTYESRQPVEAARYGCGQAERVRFTATACTTCHVSVYGDLDEEFQRDLRTVALMSTAPPSASVVVHDVAASRHDCRRLAGIVGGGATPGLLLHAAGPTAEGFRTVDVWRDETTWRHHRDRWLGALEALDTPPVVRELAAARLLTSDSPGPRSIP